ncbi:MAG: hypothetical protein ABFD79_15090 [Phycisphaerales bacterium]
MNNHYLVGKFCNLSRTALPAAGWYGTSKTIRVCVVGEKVEGASDYQVGRTEELVEDLAHKFSITPANIHYPWQL